MSVIQISPDRFLQEVDAISALDPAYRSGGSGTDGTCDCIGLILGAIRRAGGKWPGLHGSNYAARNEMADLAMINSARDLAVGELVYKHYAPADPGYNLPARYRGGKDLNDYYHVGIVTSVSPLRIRHMTSPRMQTDTKLGAWSHHGWCKRIAPPGPETCLSASGTDQLPSELVSQALSALARIELQLDLLYDLLGGRG